MWCVIYKVSENKTKKSADGKSNGIVEGEKNKP